MLRLGVLAYLFLYITLGANYALAADFTVSPLLIDKTSEARDIFSRTITITNTTSRLLRLYASVHQIEPGTDDEIKAFVTPAMTNRAETITSWLEITRARIEIPPGESKEIDLTVKVHPEVKPGEYHAYIGFVTGPNRDEAEAKIIAGQSQGVVLRIGIGEKLREQVQLTSFVTDKFSLGEETQQYSFTLVNRGELAVVPSGEVIIYDTRGREIDSVPINTAGNELAPGQEAKFAETLPFTGKIGRHKAYLNVNYGLRQPASVYDTAFYYSIPWQYALLFGFMLLLVSLSLALIFRNLHTRAHSDSSDTIERVVVKIRAVKEHRSYDHDIDLKKKN